VATASTYRARDPRVSIADLVFRESRTGWAGSFDRRLRARMAFAFAVSLALHLLAPMGFDWGEILHTEPPDSRPLKARIAPLKPLAAAPVPASAAMPGAQPNPKPKPKPKPAARLPRAAEVVTGAPPPAPVPEPPAPEPRVPEPAAVEAGKPEPAPEAQPAPEPPSAAEPASTEPALAEAPIDFPQGIDLEFNLSTGPEGAPIGRVVHTFERDGERYLIRSTTEATGLGALFASGKVVQESAGVITADGLRPERFSVQRGRASRNDTAVFDWANSKATLTSGGSTREWDLEPGAQDLLSFMHQLSFIVGNPAPPVVWVTTARRFDPVRIVQVGAEVVETELGPISAVHFRNESDDDRLRLNVWLAPDYGNLPVKIRLRDRRGDEAEQVLANMKVR